MESFQKLRTSSLNRNEISLLRPVFGVLFHLVQDDLRQRRGIEGVVKKPTPVLGYTFHERNVRVVPYSYGRNRDLKLLPHHGSQIDVVALSPSCNTVAQDDDMLSPCALSLKLPLRLLTRVHVVSHSTVYLRHYYST